MTNGTNTMKHVRKIAKTIQEMEDYREGRFKDQIKDTNGKLKWYCEGNGFVYVDNDNINEKSLNKKHLDK